MFINAVAPYRFNNFQLKQQNRMYNNIYQPSCDCVSFGGVSSEIIKPLRERFESGNVSVSEIKKMFSSFPSEYAQRIAEIAAPFEQYGIDKYTIFKRAVYQPTMLTSQADKVVGRIKAHAFVVRHKTGGTPEEVINAVIEGKNLGYSLDKIFAPLLVNKIFKSTGRPKMFVDESGMVNTLKRYCRNNPDAEFDEVEILQDEMTDRFIDFVKKLSLDISGREDLFKIKVKEELRPLNAPQSLKEDKQPTIREILAHMKYNFFDNENKDKQEFLGLYKMLPERYHKNIAGFVYLLRQNGINASMEDALRLFLRNIFMFNMKAPETINLIKVKNFIDKNTGKGSGKLEEVLENGFFPSHDFHTYYSHFLFSKMFPEKSKAPWYLKAPKGQNLTDDIRRYLRDNPTYRLEFSIKDDCKAESFRGYTQGLSRSAIGRNAFRISIEE